MTHEPPTPKEICLEDLDLDPEDQRYLRCVALPDIEPGLALDRLGAVLWMPELASSALVGLWVSADDQLVLQRGAQSETIVVERAGRSLEAPAGKPVILRDQDLLCLGGRRLRVHVHGEAEEVYPPEPVSASSLARWARSAAAAVALAAAGLASGAAGAEAGQAGVAGPEIEVRARPPAPPKPWVSVFCEISRYTTPKNKAKGPLLLHARCPAGKAVPVGTRGEILDDKSNYPIKGGTVIVEKSKGRDVVARSRLQTKPTGSKHVRFRVRR